MHRPLGIANLCSQSHCKHSARLRTGRREKGVDSDVRVALTYAELPDLRRSTSRRSQRQPLQAALFGRKTNRNALCYVIQTIRVGVWPTYEHECAPSKQSQRGLSWNTVARFVGAHGLGSESRKSLDTIG